MDLPIVLSHKTAWMYHNVARPSELLSRASSLYDEDSLASRTRLLARRSRPRACPNWGSMPRG